jgi:predicted metal-binding membrane protein
VQARSDARLFGVIVVGLAALAWAALILTEHSHGVAALDHHALGDFRLDMSQAVAAAVFTAGWLLMTVAMMLPTTLPLATLFAGMTRRRQSRGVLLGLLLCGYLAAWTLFGAAAYVFDIGVHRLVEADRWLHANSWLLLALPLIAAGIYQFTPMKYLCLDKCRSPFSFITESWHGRRPALEALQLGWRHGIFCVGCCWSLMLLMFAVGVGSLVWMLVLAVVMGVEKNLPWGRQITLPVGVVLLSAGLTVVGVNSGLVL